MLSIEGVVYRQCGHCLEWRPADELVWNNERLDWVGYDTACLPW